LSKFTEAELEYLKTQHIGRLATVNKRGEPQNNPVGFRYNADLDVIEIGGPWNGKTQRFRNVVHNGLASFVVDDLTQEGGRGIEIRAHAEVFPEGGQLISPGFSPEVIRLVPRRIITWDLSRRLFPNAARNVE